MFYGFQSNPPEHERIMALIWEVKRAYQAIGVRTYTGDMLCAFGRSQGFAYDPKFRMAFDGKASDVNEESWQWRLHILTWAASEALCLDGDFVECGTFRGFMSAVVCDYLDFERQPKRFFLYDSFSGLSEAWSTARELELNKAYAEATDYNVESVRARFSRYTNVHVIQGIVPDVLYETAPERIAYLHIDLNAAEAEIGALDLLFDRVVPGGRIVFDDFGRIPKLHEAETKWMQERGYRILELPTGQGLVVKR